MPQTPEPNPLAVDEDAIASVLRHFTSAPGVIHEGQADDLVRARVDGSMRVVAIEILPERLEDCSRTALETAAVAAVNLALERAALAVGAALADLDKGGAGPAR